MNAWVVFPSLQRCGLPVLVRLSMPESWAVDHHPERTFVEPGGSLYTVGTSRVTLPRFYVDLTPLYPHVRHSRAAIYTEHLSDELLEAVAARELAFAVEGRETLLPPSERPGP